MEESQASHDCGCGVNSQEPVHREVHKVFYYIDTSMTATNGEKDRQRGRRLLPFLRSTHDFFHGISRGFPLVQNGIHLRRDGEFNLVVAGECQ